MRFHQHVPLGSSPLAIVHSKKRYKGQVAAQLHKAASSYFISSELWRAIYISPPVSARTWTNTFSKDQQLSRTELGKDNISIWKAHSCKGTVKNPSSQVISFSSPKQTDTQPFTKLFEGCTEVAAWCYTCQATFTTCRSSTPAMQHAAVAANSPAHLVLAQSMYIVICPSIHIVICSIINRLASKSSVYIQKYRNSRAYTLSY